jgi:hypothetical protein
VSSEPITLKEYVLALLRERDEAVRTALASLDKLLDGMNEFRQTLTDQARGFMPRAEAELRLKALEDQGQKRAGFSGGWAVAVVVVGVVSLVVGLILSLRGI